MDAERLINIVIRNRYRIIQFLGSGSFGDTYIAEDLDLPSNPKCVVKQLKPKTSEEEVLLVARRLFESEAKFLYRLGKLSNQIPKLFAHFEENGEFYLVQEFIDGHELTAEIIPASQWSEGEVVKLLQEILQVLTVVHQENIIHRDIKPANLIRRRNDGKIVMIDFGAVKEIKGLARNTQGQVTSTIAIGSNGYMPNEQANSKPQLCSDIYAVGVIGIQALTGKLPHNFQEDITNGEIIWQREANVSDKLANVLTKMVRYNFSQRYQTAAEALQALTSLPSISKSPSLSIFTLQKSGLKQKILVGAGVGVSVLLGVGLLFMIFLKEPIPNIKLVCQETSVPPLPSTPDWESNNTEYYGFIKNSTTGKGTLIISEQQKVGFSRYDGELKKGLFNGCGTYKDANGDRYIGQFENGSYQGVGKLILVNSTQYEGEFKKNKFHGRGIYTFANGGRYIGQFENGSSQGVGKLICKNGSRHEVEFKDNKICE